MSLIKISQLPTMSQADVDPNTDIVPIVDTTTGQTKHVLLAYIQTSGSGGSVGTLQQVMDSGSTWNGSSAVDITTSNNLTISASSNLFLYTNGGRLWTKGNFFPSVDNEWNIGDINQRYKTLYINDVTGSSFTGSFVGDGSGLTNISTSDDLQAVLDNGSTASLSSNLLIDGGATQEVRITGSYLDFYTDSTMRLESIDGGQLLITDGVEITTGVGLSVTGPTNLNETTISGSDATFNTQNIYITSSKIYHTNTNNSSIPKIERRFNRTTTTGALNVALTSIPIPTDRVVNIEANITAKTNSSPFTSSYYSLSGTFINDGGNVSQVSGSSYIVSHDDFSTPIPPSFLIVILNDEVEVRVQGVTGKTLIHNTEIIIRDLA